MLKLQNNYFFLRHGENNHMVEKPNICYPAKGNLDKIYLTKKGKEQIKKAALELKEEKIDLIFSSDFLRTKETSLIVAEEIQIKKEDIIFSSELRDGNLGVYHGKPKENYRKEIGALPSSYNKKPKDGESLKEIEERVVNFLIRIDRKYRGKNILIVGHGHPLWLLEAWIHGIRISDMNKNGIRKNYIQVGELRKIKIT